MCIDVKQEPGMTYPKPVDHVTIVERTAPAARASAATAASAPKAARSRVLGATANESETRDHGPIHPTSGDR